VTHMDLENHFRLKLESLLMNATWVERLRAELGLTGVSQVWSGKPAWYFWLRDAAGAFCLELVETGWTGGGQAHITQGLFTIRYYPNPDEPDFSSFSPQEQALALGPGFDHSHTPRFETLPEIPDGCFRVGVLQWSLPPEGDWALFSLSAMQTCRFWSGPQAGRPPMLLRCIPGLDLSRCLFKVLLGLFSFTSKQTPVRARLYKHPGFEQQESGGQSIWRESGEFDLFNLEVFYSNRPGHLPRAARRKMEPLEQQDDVQVIFDQVFECAHYHGPQNCLGTDPLLNPKWWHLAHADYKSELASSCGCAH
jgi:hypothetical protein